MTGRLDGKVAIITGAGRGQGAAEAELFVTEGAQVILADILIDEVREVAESLGDAAVATGLDVSSAEQWDDVVALASSLGGLDCLINNAGVTRIVPLEHETVDGFHQMFEVNVIGAFLGMTAALPLLQERGGSIVNIGSTSALAGLAYHGAYGASKWALRGMSRTAALEWGHYGIRVNTIHPGPIDTPMLPPPKTGTAEGRFAHLPLGRAGQAAEVAQLALFLASDESSYQTGGDYTIDGGSTAGPPLRYEWKPPS